MSKRNGKWHQAHDNLSCVLISSLMKKYDRRQKAVAIDLGISQTALNFHIQKLGLLEPGAIDKYAIDYTLLGTRGPQSATQPQASKVA